MIVTSTAAAAIDKDSLQCIRMRTPRTGAGRY